MNKSHKRLLTLVCYTLVTHRGFFCSKSKTLIWTIRSTHTHTNTHTLARPPLPPSPCKCFLFSSCLSQSVCLQTGSQRTSFSPKLPVFTGATEPKVPDGRTDARAPLAHKTRLCIISIRGGARRPRYRGHFSLSK